MFGIVEELQYGNDGTQINEKLFEIILTKSFSRT